MSPSAIIDETATGSRTNGNPICEPENDSGAKPINHNDAALDPIAIVGIACRFSGDVSSPQKLWDLCASGKDGWSPIPKSRFDIESVYHKDKERTGRTHATGGYFLDEDIALFDAAFFNLSGEIAGTIDPQVRLLLEVVYEATEDAGMPMEKLAGSNTSVYSACFNKDYHELQMKDPETLPHSCMTGTGTAMLSNRVSHFYDLLGPSMSIDTGCSAGLVALHQGCRSIRYGESDVSIVGGASTILSPDAFIVTSSLGATGADGRCYAWDSRAHGYGRGEGVAALVLKRLSAALKDGDRIHAMVRETGLNQDGKTTTISSPSADAQARLIRDCYKRAGLDMSETGYVEAHMTGTPAGDPIEAEALARTFGRSRAAGDPLIVGSVKTNVGHTEPVSGLAAVIKTTFALKNGMIPPNLNYEVTNPSIPLDEWHLQVPTALTLWPAGKPLRASINNFGYGGTNAHLILEAAPKAVPKQNGVSGTNGICHSGASQVYILSAKDKAGATTMATNFANHIRQLITEGREPSLTDLAYTLGERRSRFPWVMAVRAGSLSELAGRLEESSRKPSRASKAPRLGFAFNGQGAQWHAMGRELITTYPVFGAGIQRASKILHQYGASWSLHDELMRDERSTRVNEVNISQPLSVAVQLCLVDLLTAWGIRPSAITSHSSGEIAAAYTVGALTFEHALGVAYFRGELALEYGSSLSGGMMAAALEPATAEEYIGRVAHGKAVVACINSPKSVTLSGDTSAINELESLMRKDGVFARKLKVPMAYHSHHMLFIAPMYTERLQTILPSNHAWTGVRFTSPVTGGKVTSPKVFSAEHWARNLTSPVRFSEAFENMCFDSGLTSKDLHVDAVVEIGAHSTLAGPIRQILDSCGAKLPYVSCLKRSTNAVTTMQDLACELLTLGYPVDLAAVNQTSSQKNTFVHDLPSYPWNHTTRYWVEPRISKEMNSRRFPPHELLGTLIPGGNDLSPTWRNFIRLSDMEWLRDHQVDSKFFFPGAGFVVMAIEAARLLVDPSEGTISGYRLRDVDIANALVIPESGGGVETHLLLRECSERELDHEGWYEFEVCSLGAANTWTLNCRGSVKAETVAGAEGAAEAQCPHEEAYLGGDSQTTDVDIQDLYANMRVMGIYHGPSFQNLVASRRAGKRATSDLVIADIASEVHDYILHPTTLDCIIQATYSSLPTEPNQGSMVLPRSFRSLYIPRGLRRMGKDELKVFTELVRSEKKGYTLHVMATNSDTDVPEPFLEMQDFFGQLVQRESDEGAVAQPLCAKSRWEMDILHNVPASFKDGMTIPHDEKEAELVRQLEQVSYTFMHDAVKELEGEDREAWSSHHKRFFAWMQAVVSEGGHHSVTWSTTTAKEKEAMADALSEEDVSGRLTVRVGRNLTNILRGDITPLELMMQDNLLDEFYMNRRRFKARSSKHLSQIAELFAVKNPGARVLEIGGGTGGATGTILGAFAARCNKDQSGTLLGGYTFTDISAGFFEAARAKFADWSYLMEFKKLDIETDPTEQSFEAGNYDLVVASMVLHATKDLHKSLSHVRRLLKPGGKLLMIETTQDRLDMQLIFGTLPGWWLAEEPERQMSPNAPLTTWDRILRERGFTGVDFDIGDFAEMDLQSDSVILATASTSVVGPSVIVHSEEEASTPFQRQWLSRLAERIQAETGDPVTVESIDQAQCQDKICIFTPEMGAPYVAGMDEKSFVRVREVLLSSRGTLWLSCGGLVDCQEPLFAATQGLLRSFRNGEVSKPYIHLDFDRSPAGPWTEENLGHVMHVLRSSFSEGVETSGVDWEYAVKDSVLFVPRLFPDGALDAAVSDRPSDPVPQLQPFHQPGRPLVCQPSSTNAGVSGPYFVDMVDLSQPVPSGSIEVEIRAIGLGFRDQSGGFECAGVITSLGPDTKESGLSIGDRVCALVVGPPISSVSQIPWTAAAKIPDSMSWEYAASVPIAYVTVYTCLVSISKLRRGESVLIHEAASSTGQAAVVLAQMVGAKVLATCNTEAERDLLMEKYNLDAHDIIMPTRVSSLYSTVMAKMSNKGADVVLNTFSGVLLKESWECIARFGRFVDISGGDGDAACRLDTTPFHRCATYSSFDIKQFCEHNGSLVQEVLQACIAMLQECEGQPVWPISSYPISDMENALRLVQGDAHMSKVVLTCGDTDLVNVSSRPGPVSLDDSEATYLIVGGVTGIGLAIAEWMMEVKSTKHILVVSRRATTHEHATRLAEVAGRSGCNLQIRDCDVSNEGSLLGLLAEVSQSMPPIRGVVNGAMVLDDTILERMTFEQWQRALTPKISGSLNLHKHLLNQRFFIMLSSLTGVAGHVSQANYAAGNTFQDALARHRTRQGQAGSAIDLGPVLGVGFVAERLAAGDGRIARRLGTDGMEGVEIATVLRLVEAAIRDSAQSGQADDAQIVVGLADFDAFPPDAPARQDKRLRTLQLTSRRGRDSTTEPTSSSSGQSTTALIEILSSPSTTLEEAMGHLVSALTEQLAKIFNIPATDIDTEMPMSHYGVDSLVAVELRNWLSGVARAKMSVFEVLQSVSIREFGALVAVRSELVASEPGKLNGTGKQEVQS